MVEKNTQFNQTIRNMQTISVETPFQATNTETSESVTDRKYINA